MKVYLAARYSMRDKLREYANELEELEIDNTARWLDETIPGSSNLDDMPKSFFLSAAINDVEDIKAADAVVLFTVDPKIATMRGGRHFESGLAYGMGKPLVICGPEENIFHMLPNVTVCADWESTKLNLLGRRFDESRNRSFGTYSKYTWSETGPGEVANLAGSPSVLSTRY